MFRPSYAVSEILRFSCKPKMTSSVCLRQGALCTVLNDRIWKGDYGFLLVFNSNFISIMRRFRDNDVFLKTGKNVMVISSLGGTLQSFDDRFWKSDPKFIFILHISPIFNRFRVNQLFILAVISLLPAKFVGFSGKMTPKKSKFRKTLA